MKFKATETIAIAFLILSSGCAVVNTENNNFNSTLWIQTASECKANALLVYNAALQNIQLAIDDPSWTAL